MKNDIKAFLCGKAILSALFLGIFASPALAALSCSGSTSSTQYGMENGTCYAYYCSGTTVNKLGSVSSSYCSSSSSSCTSGNTQEKYTASGCSYNTSKRICCSGSWSDWGVTDCSSTCGSGECWNGSSCTTHGSGTTYQGLKNVFYNGSCYYQCTWTCNKGSGWSCAKKGITAQSGSFTTSTYYGNQGSICSTKVTSSAVETACCQQGASLRGIPYEAMCVNNHNIHEGDCYQITGTCTCTGGSKYGTTFGFTTLSEAYYKCGYSYSFTCPAKKLSCTSKTYSC